MLRRIILIILIFLFNGCSHKKLDIKTRDFIINSSILKDEFYYFSAKKPDSLHVEYQPLKRFDLIFVGHSLDINSTKYNKLQNLSALIPGTYTHVLAYIGKDSNGFAYAVEMNADKEQSFTIDNEGVKLGGKLYFYCLGSDFGKKNCPNDNYIHGMKSYDYMWAKRPKFDLKKYEKELLVTIQNDLKEEHPFQIPLDLSLKTQDTKLVTIVDDGRKNGSSCAEYFVSLFEEVADVCLNDVRIDAKTLKNYYINDEIGKRAVVPVKYSVFFKRTIYLKETFDKLGYDIQDNKPRDTKCKQKVGIVTPDLLFRSGSMRDIKPIKGKGDV